MPHAPNHALPRQRWLLALAAAVCLLCWLAMGLSLALDADRTLRLVFVIAAALSTEALLWLLAVVLGVSALQPRRHLWRKLEAALRKALNN